jgi:mannan endo-1,4-beta-mannosidase
MIAAASVVMGIVGEFALHSTRHPAPTGRPVPQRHGLPITPDSYIGLYTYGVPNSYAGITAFTKATGIKPRVVVYYSGWQERFKVAFAKTVANEGAVPLVQMNPTRTKIAAIAEGKYDNYLSTYANAVRTYHHQVILSFGHEMNGYWYSWAYTHTSPAVFVAAWRHVVTLFRARGAQNVTWLWTINTIHKKTRVPSFQNRLPRQ